jgi:DNA polymerase-3 subunit gamma/tau
MAAKLSMPQLTRVWQMLLKGATEVRNAPQPSQAAEMIFVRLCFAADLPTPAEMIAQLNAGGGTAERVAPAAPRPEPAPAPPAQRRNPAPNGPSGALAMKPEAPPVGEPESPQVQPQSQPQTFEDVVDLFRRMKELKLWAHLMNDVHLVRFEPGQIELRLGAHAPADLTNRVIRQLRDWTGAKWFVTVRADVEGEPTLRARRDAAERLERDAAANHPAVRAVLEAFPGAQFVGVVERAAEPEADPDAEPETPIDPPDSDDGDEPL